MTGGGPHDPGAGPTRPRILVTGGNGQVGHYVATCPMGDAIPVGRDELDLTDPASIAAALDRHAPEVVINAAAYTDVDGAESDEAVARAVNTDGVESLAVACRDRGIRLIHLSTDYVFSGEVPGGGDPATAPALEPHDPTAPATAYGRTKLAGERAALAVYPETTIVRTAWVYSGPERHGHGLRGSDFVDTMVRLERERDTVSVVDDQWGSPTYAAELAWKLLGLVVAEQQGRADTRGLTLHLAGAGRTTWCGLARAVLPWFGADPERVRPCTTEEFPRPAPRPAFSVLSDASWRAAGLEPMDDWRTDLARAVANEGRKVRRG